VDAALKKLKFGQELIFATVFAELMSPVVAAEFADCDLIIPVPLHRGRQFRRGFNQAYEIGRDLGRRCCLPIGMPVVRTRPTPSQSGLSAADRHRNIRGAFRLRGGPTGRHPLIVDDVISTGATCNQLARVLLDAGAESVSVLTVARSGYY
jgi:ComF family protein